MDALRQPTPKVPLRSPDVVMRLARLGSFHQCRLSFMRTLLRRLKRESWKFERPIFDLDEKGVGAKPTTRRRRQEATSPGIHALPSGWE